MRKVIAIVSTWVPPFEGFHGDYVLTALCDDGTLWERCDSTRAWRQIEGVPQPELSEPGWRDVA